MKLHLGVLDLPYADNASYKETNVRKPKHKPKGGGISTFRVAEILERKYGVMGRFVELHGQMIADELANAYEGALESISMGAPVTLDAAGSATQQIEDQFKQMLSNKELDGMGVPGVPTQAALLGHSKRFKQPYKNRAPRPSFIDTGLYQGAFKAWVDDEG